MFGTGKGIIFDALKVLNLNSGYLDRERDWATKEQIASKLAKLYINASSDNSYFSTAYYKSYWNSANFMSVLKKPIDNLQAVDIPKVPLDSKTRNAFYVANIIRNHKLLKNAANFYCKVLEYYNRKEVLGKISSYEGHHSWPVPSAELEEDGMLIGGIPGAWKGMPLSGVMMNNLNNRGYLQLIATWAYDKTVGAGITGKTNMDTAYNSCLRQMKSLSRMPAPYSDDDIGYILRGMMQLRDITKYEKHRKADDKDSMNEFYSLERNKDIGRPRITGNGVRESRQPTRNLPSTPLDRKAITQLYRKRSPSADSAHRGGKYVQHDFIQGMSGSTVDYSKWLYYMIHELKHYEDESNSNQDKSSPNYKDKSNSNPNIETVKLFQVNYAAWHLVAPNGLAHSQMESISVLLKKFYGRILGNDIMTPVVSEDDIRNMGKYLVDKDDVNFK